MNGIRRHAGAIRVRRIPARKPVGIEVFAPELRRAVANPAYTLGAQIKFYAITPSPVTGFCQLIYLANMP